MPLVALARRPWAGARVHSRPPPLTAGSRRHRLLRIQPFSFQSRSREPDEQTAPNLLDILQQQDPHGRITMEEPRQFNGIFSYGCSPTDISFQLGGAELAEPPIPHLLPFWTVLLLYPVRLTSIKPGTGKSWPDKRRQYHVMTGCSVPAVPKGHWAFGATMTDFTRFMGVAQMEADRPPQPLNWKRLETYKAAALDDTPLAAGEYDPDTMPMFAYGPPIPGPTEQINISRLHTFLRPSGEGSTRVITDHVIGGEMTVRTFPQYRLVYKAQLVNGRVGIVDPTWGQMPNGVGSTGYILGSPEGTISTRHPYLVPSKRYEQAEILNTGSTVGFLRTGNSAIPFQTSHASEFQSRQFEDIIIRAMERHTMAPNVWEDPRILTTSRGLGEPNINTIFDYIEELLLGEPAEALVWPGIKPVETTVKASLSSHLTQRRAPAKPKPKLKAQPKLEAEPSSSAATMSSAFRRATLGRVNEPVSREAFMNSRARAEIDRQLKWKTAPAATATPKKPAPKPIPELDDNKELKATEGRPVARQKAVNDAEGHYKTMGIKLQNDLVLYSKETEVNEMLKDKFLDLSFKHHPDHADGTDAEVARRNRTMSDINIAYGYIKTCESRVNYHNKSS